jgi:hypothetical protein
MSKEFSNSRRVRKTKGNKERKRENCDDFSPLFFFLSFRSFTRQLAEKLLNATDVNHVSYVSNLSDMLARDKRIDRALMKQLERLIQKRGEGVWMWLTELTRNAPSTIDASLIVAMWNERKDVKQGPAVSFTPPSSSSYFSSFLLLSLR